MSSSSTPELTGQVAIVTGAGRGIGRAIALALANAGATVAVADMDTTDTAASIEASGGHAVSKTVDVTDQPAVDRMVREVEQQFGAVDLLMNNAAVGAGSVGLTWEVDPDLWWRTVNVNLRGQFLCARAVLPGMIRRRQGRIINMGSGGSYMDQALVSAYNASKAAAARFTGCLAIETREYGIAVFTTNPGFVRTHLVEASMTAAPEEVSRGVADFFNSGGGDPPERCAQLVVQLASGKADVLSGRFIEITDDLDELIQRADEIARDDLYALRRPIFKHGS